MISGQNQSYMRWDKHDSLRNNECKSRLRRRRRASVRKSQNDVIEFVAMRCDSLLASIYHEYYIPLAIGASRRPRSQYYAPRIFDSATYQMLRSDQEYPTTSGIMSNMS